MPDTAKRTTLAARKLFWIVLGATFVVDQLAKGIAQVTLKPDGWQPGDPAPHYPFINGVVHGTWAIGGLPAMGGAKGMLWISIPVAILFWGAIMYVVAFKRGRRHALTLVSAGLVYGGLLSNLLDMALFRGARNFMELGFDNPLRALNPNSDNGMFAQHPLFSTAALAMWIGLPLLVIGALLDKRKRKPEPPAPPPPRPRAGSTRPYGYQDPPAGR
jgi:lipoprotein signal peptidase